MHSRTRENKQQQQKTQRTFLCLTLLKNCAEIMKIVEARSSEISFLLLFWYNFLASFWILNCPPHIAHRLCVCVCGFRQSELVKFAKVLAAVVVFLTNLFSYLVIWTDLRFRYAKKKKKKTWYERYDEEIICIYAGTHSTAYGIHG